MARATRLPITSGTPRVVTNSSAGVVSRHDYKPFGEEIGSGIGSRTTAMGYSVADGVRQRFTSKERDNETGLDYFGARYFASTQGRFTSPDPVSFDDARKYEPQAINLYAYCGNNPLTRVDPDGRYYVGTNGKRVSVTRDANGHVHVGTNANASLRRYAELVNKVGSSEAVSAMLKVASNATKVHFNITQDEKFYKDGSRMYGLHQAHDKNGKALEWDDKSNKFVGEAALIKGKGGTIQYKEATITIYEGSINANLDFFVRRYTDPNITPSETIVTVGAHEETHDTDQDSISAVKDRQEGRSNPTDVESPATAVEQKAADEIKKKRKP
jgi:RHS repeat-associated protein